MKYSQLISIILIALNLLFASTISIAEDNLYLLVEKNWKKLSEINKLLDAGQASDAINQLNALLPQVQDKAYDTAVTQQTLGYAYSTINDYPNAIQAFRGALSNSALPRDVIHNLEFNLAQLLIFTEQYPEGLKYLDRWIKAESSPTVDAYILAGTAHYESGQFQSAIPYAKNVINLKSTYDETWHQLLLSCYLKTNQYKNAANLLEKMLRISPNNKTYWQQLLATWQHTDNDKKILATMELMHTKGLFNKDDVKQLINMYRYLDMPYKAANLLQTQLDNGEMPKDAVNWELLGTCWLQAQEREISAKTLIKAANLSGDGNLYYKIGQIYFDLEDYPQTISNLKTAISKGKLTQHSYAQLLLGIAFFHQKDYSKSQQNLELALNSQSTKSQADWWIQRIKDLDQQPE